MRLRKLFARLAGFSPGVVVVDPANV